MDSSTTSSLTAQTNSPSTEKVAIQILTAVGVVAAILIPLTIMMCFVWRYSRGRPLLSLKRRLTKEKPDVETGEAKYEAIGVEHTAVPVPAYMLTPPPTPAIQAIEDPKDLPALDLGPSLMNSKVVNLAPTPTPTTSQFYEIDKDGPYLNLGRAYMTPS
jgi:hypothetical protein